MRCLSYFRVTAKLHSDGVYKKAKKLVVVIDPFKIEVNCNLARFSRHYNRLNDEK